MERGISHEFKRLTDGNLRDELIMKLAVNWKVLRGLGLPLSL